MIVFLICKNVKAEYYMLPKLLMRIMYFKCFYINPGPAGLVYALRLHTVKIHISWLLKKPTDLDLHC